MNEATEYGIREKETGNGVIAPWNGELPFWLCLPQSLELWFGYLLGLTTDTHMKIVSIIGCTLLLSVLGCKHENRSAQSAPAGSKTVSDGSFTWTLGAATMNGTNVPLSNITVRAAQAKPRSDPVQPPGYSHAVPLGLRNGWMVDKIGGGGGRCACRFLREAI